MATPGSDSEGEAGFPLISMLGEKLPRGSLLTAVHRASVPPPATPATAAPVAPQSEARRGEGSTSAQTPVAAAVVDLSDEHESPVPSTSSASPQPQKKARVVLSPIEGPDEGISSFSQ